MPKALTATGKMTPAYESTRPSFKVTIKSGIKRTWNGTMVVANMQ